MLRVHSKLVHKATEWKQESENQTEYKSHSTFAILILNLLNLQFYASK